MRAAGSTSDAQIFKHTDLRHKIEDGSIGFPDSESRDWWIKGEPFPVRGRCLPPKALANEALLQPQYGLGGEDLQL